MASASASVISVDASLASKEANSGFYISSERYVQFVSSLKEGMTYNVCISSTESTSTPIQIFFKVGLEGHLERVSDNSDNTPSHNQLKGSSCDDFWEKIKSDYLLCQQRQIHSAPVASNSKVLYQHQEGDYDVYSFGSSVCSRSETTGIKQRILRFLSRLFNKNIHPVIHIKNNLLIEPQTTQDPKNESYRIDTAKREESTPSGTLNHASEREDLNYDMSVPEQIIDSKDEPQDIDTQSRKEKVHSGTLSLGCERDSACCSMKIAATVEVKETDLPLPSSNTAKEQQATHTCEEIAPEIKRALSDLPQSFTYHRAGDQEEFGLDHFAAPEAITQWKSFLHPRKGTSDIKAQIMMALIVFSKQNPQHTIYIEKYSPGTCSCGEITVKFGFQRTASISVEYGSNCCTLSIKHKENDVTQYVISHNMKKLKEADEEPCNFPSKDSKPIKESGVAAGIMNMPAVTKRGGEQSYLENWAISYDPQETSTQQEIIKLLEGCEQVQHDDNDPNSAKTKEKSVLDRYTNGITPTSRSEFYSR